MQAAQNSKNAMILLWLTAAIWGFAFVAQRAGMEFIGPFTYNGIRFGLGSLSLLPLLTFIRQKRGIKLTSTVNLLRNGLLTGVVLFIAASFQQAGIVWTSAGKAGFITGFYVIFVPLIGIFLGQMINRYTWIGAFFALAGLFLLTINERLSIGKGDLLVLVSAFFWAIHVQLINHQVKDLPAIPLSILQFATCSLLSLVTAGIFETIELQGILDAAIPILYGGFLSVGIAYTLQVVAQKHVHPTYASIILSFETVFAAIGGWLILNERMAMQGLLGCLLMFFGMWVVQKFQIEKQ